jgi:hypothetical protein
MVIIENNITIDKLENIEFRLIINCLTIDTDPESNNSVILLNKNESLKENIHLVDKNVNYLVISNINYENNNFKYSIENPIDFTDVEFKQFPFLKEIHIYMSCKGFTNNTFLNCNELKKIYFGTVKGNPFENDCSFLYSLPKLETIRVNYCGICEIGNAFDKYIKENTGKINYEFIC